MKVLCLGNNSEDTDIQTAQLAKNEGCKKWGLVTDPNIDIQKGFYHTSIYDLTVSQIMILIKKFDQLILLNQPVNQWSHSNAFYLTIKLIDDAESIIPVKRLTDDNGINFFEELVNVNKSFCIFPFIELVVQNNHTSVCCRSKNPIIKIDDLTNWQNNKQYEDIRNKMLQGEKLPDHCSYCYRYESQGIISARQQETVEWANRLNLRSVDDLKKIQFPVYYELFPSNVCNLQCRTCLPKNSNLIEKEYIELGWHDPSIKFKHTNFDFVNINQIEKLYVAGGEPTATNETYNFLNKCIQEKKTNFEFVINTNANKISKNFLELCNQFSNLKFVVSIDGYQSVNDYVRWPSEWKNVIKNTKKLQINHTITFNVVVSIYTVSRLDQLLEFFDKEFPTSLVHCTFADSIDGILHPDIFPDKPYLLEKLLRIKEFNCYKNDRLLKSFVDGLIKKYRKLQKIDQEKIKKFFEFNDTLDQSRNVKLVDYIPELDKFRTWC